ncbi:MAG: photosystem II reaction center protein Ycf12 [Leptolyngbya sp. Prado105]|nr:photosystem II reaction center protein Ycf12 [Leptolyngbya sp. Prado105]
MEFLSFLNDVNFTGIIQLALIAMIMLAGPVVIFLLAFRGGDL